jgi:hypothetical protein
MTLFGPQMHMKRPHAPHHSSLLIISASTTLQFWGKVCIKPLYPNPAGTHAYILIWEPAPAQVAAHFIFSAAPNFPILNLVILNFSDCAWDQKVLDFLLHMSIAPRIGFIASYISCSSGWYTSIYPWI